jgi:hypothetical protein
MKIAGSFYYIKKSNVEIGSPKPALKSSKVGRCKQPLEC